MTLFYITQITQENTKEKKDKGYLHVKTFSLNNKIDGNYTGPKKVFEDLFYWSELVWKPKRTGLNIVGIFRKLKNV